MVNCGMGIVDMIQSINTILVIHSCPKFNQTCNPNQQKRKYCYVGNANNGL